MCWQFGKEFQLGKDLLLAKRVRRAGFGKATEYSFIKIFFFVLLPPVKKTDVHAGQCGVSNKHRPAQIL